MNAADLYWGSDEFIVTAAVRYCLGRRTYIVKDCVEWILANWQRFSSYTQLTIQRDIEEIFTRDDLIRNKYGNWVEENLEWVPVYPLGNDCDRTEWERVRALWTPV